MRNFYLRNPHGFDRWLKANAILGSLLAIGMLAMALAGTKKIAAIKYNLGSRRAAQVPADREGGREAYDPAGLQR